MLEQGKCLSVVCSISETRAMLRFGSSFIGDFSNASSSFDKIQKCQLSTAYGDTELTVFILVLPRQSYGALAIDEPGNIGSIDFAY